MPNDTIAKEQLVEHSSLPTTYTQEELVKGVNIAGLISSSLQSIFASLSHGMKFREVDDATQTLVSYVHHIIDTSPYHANESVNVVMLAIDTKEGNTLGLPVMRLLHKESAEIVATFLDTFGTAEALLITDLFERANDPSLVEAIEVFIAKTADSTIDIDPENVFRAIEEYVVVSLLTGEQSIFDIETEAFITHLRDSIDVIEEDDTNDKEDKRAKRAHLRVIQ